MTDYKIEVMASHISPKTKRFCKRPQDWIAYVTHPDGKVVSMAGWATKTQAWRIAGEYVLKRKQMEAL